MKELNLVVLTLASDIVFDTLLPFGLARHPVGIVLSAALAYSGFS